MRERQSWRKNLLIRTQLGRHIFSKSFDLEVSSAPSKALVAAYTALDARFHSEYRRIYKVFDANDSV